MLDRKYVIILVSLIFAFGLQLSADVQPTCYPRIGISVLLIQDGQILLGLRKNSHGNGTWAPPGGHLEFGEQFYECAIREVAEETGLLISHLKLYAMTNDVFIEENKHYVTIFMIADQIEGKVELLEPEKCENWVWFDIHELPENLFLPFKNLIDMQQQQQ